MTDAKLPDGGAEDHASLFPKTAGERLHDARESLGLSLAEIAERTRVPIRHLEGIEKSDFSSLPSPTYAVGFAKAYARAVGLDEAMIGREIRGTGPVARPAPQYQPLEPNDPKRLPPRGLAMVGAAVALLAIIGLILIYGVGLFDGGDAAPELAVEQAAPVRQATAPAPVTAPQVVLSATDVVWLRIYTADKTLFESEMQPGDRYEVPPDAVRPMINIGRPDKLTVTVNGAAVAPLGTGDRAIKDVEVSAAALLARGAALAGATGAAGGGDQPASAAPTVERRPARREGAAPRRAAPPRSASLSDAELTRRANAAAAASTPPSGDPPAP
ncbi:MAG: DUF4115 domain-containing protein [Sphingomonas sp.]|nr:DUF4115 domain-containing protein [Sphingomonas sp.]